MLQYQLKMEDAPILRLLDSIITEGLVSGTSDIHLEPGTEYDRIRYRIDGVLQQVQRLPMERHTALVSKVAHGTSYRPGFLCETDGRHGHRGKAEASGRQGTGHA